jgi:hypothetical protein
VVTKLGRSLQSGQSYIQKFICARDIARWMSHESIQREVLKKVLSKCLARSLSALQIIADTCITFRTKMADVYIALSHWAADEIGIIAVRFVLTGVFMFMHHSPENSSAYVDNQNFLFYEVVKIWNGLHHCISLIEMVKKTYIERLIRSPDGVNCPLDLCENQKFWPPTKTSEFCIGVLALREHQNFWPPTKIFDLRSLNQGESKLNPNSSELMGNLQIKSWRGFLLG